MQTFGSARELLHPDETCLCVYIEGTWRAEGKDGADMFRSWSIDPVVPFQRVIIYNSRRIGGKQCVKLFTALPAGIESPEPDRPYPGHSTVWLREVREVGVTDTIWEEFASTRMFPVAYIDPRIAPAPAGESEPVVSRICVEYADGSTDDFNLLERGRMPLFNLRRRLPGAGRPGPSMHSAVGVALILLNTAASVHRIRLPLFDRKLFAALKEWSEGIKARWEEEDV